MRRGLRILSVFPLEKNDRLTSTICPENAASIATSTLRLAARHPSHYLVDFILLAVLVSRVKVLARANGNLVQLGSWGHTAMSTVSLSSFATTSLIAISFGDSLEAVHHCSCKFIQRHPELAESTRRALLIVQLRFDQGRCQFDDLNARCCQSGSHRQGS